MNFPTVQSYVKGVLKGAFANKKTLDKLSTSDTGTLLFDGNEINSSSSGSSTSVNIATTSTVGTVKPDGSTITITDDGTISSTQQDLSAYAKTEDIPTFSNKDTLDKLTTSNDGNLLFNGNEIKGGSSTEASIATTNATGIVKPDGSTITITDDGTISATQQDLTTYAKTEDIPSLDGYAKTEDIPTFSNKSTLDKLTTSTDGNLLFDGNEIKGGSEVSIATTDAVGTVKPDGTTITVAEDGTISGTATVEIDNETIKKNESGQIYAVQQDLSQYAKTESLPTIATDSTTGLVMPDGTTTEVDTDGKLSVKTATSTSLGIVKPDNNTISVNDDGSIQIDKSTFYAGKLSYSEDEKVVGVWTDGKPIYRKSMVIDTFTPTGGTMYSKQIDVSDLNVSYMINISGIVRSGNADSKAYNEIPYCYLPSTYSNLWFCRACYLESTKKIHFDVQESTGYETDMILYLEYTKTTDSENSYKDSMLSDRLTTQCLTTNFEDYSTDEIVVGRWIDGRPIYRKTITSFGSFTLSSTEHSESLDLSSLSIKEMLNYSGSGIVNGTIRRQIPYNTVNSSVHASIFLDFGSGSLKLIGYCTSSSYTISSIEITIEYTKTTDAENSFTYDMLENNYTDYLTEDLTDDDYNTLMGVE